MKIPAGRCDSTSFVNSSDLITFHVLVIVMHDFPIQHPRHNDIHTQWMHGPAFSISFCGRSQITDGPRAVQNSFVGQVDPSGEYCLQRIVNNGSRFKDTSN